MGSRSPSEVRRTCRTRRFIGWAMAALLAAPFFVLLAWLASNWRDVPAQPRPAELALPPARLKASDNAYAALSQIKAPADGSTAWLGDPSGPPWFCAEGSRQCATGWLMQPEALARQRASVAWGPRCDALLDGPFALEEVIAEPLKMTSSIAEHLSGANACLRWFMTGAVLALQRGDDAAFGRELARANKLNRALLDGSHSLIAHMVALRRAEDVLDLVSALAVRDAALADTLEPLIRGWPAQEVLVRRWMSFESSYSQVALATMFEGCADAAGTAAARAQLTRTVAERVEDTLQDWLCRRRVGIQPERTAQDLDEMWLRRLALLEKGGVGALEQHDRTLEAQSPAPWRWQNTLAARTIDVGAGALLPHLRRHLDTELQHRLVTQVLAMQREGVEAPARAAWLARQRLSAEEPERITVRDGGSTIVAHGFSGAQPALERGEFVVRWPR